MAEPVEKGRKGKRRRPSEHIHYYVNMNKPRDYHGRPVDDDEDCPTPQHAAAAAMVDADCDKSTGNPVPQGAEFTAGRVSPSRVSGQAAPSSGDHGAGFRDPMNQPGPRALAYAHPDLRQSSTRLSKFPWSLSTVNGDDGAGDRSIIFAAGRVQVNQFDAAGQSGTFAGMNPVRPDPQRPDWHWSRSSTTPVNGGHSTGMEHPVSHAGAPGAMNWSDALQVMKETQLPR